MSIFSALVFWFLTLTGNVQLCDADIPDSCEQGDDACQEEQEERRYRLLLKTQTQPTNDISNGF